MRVMGWIERAKCHGADQRLFYADDKHTDLQLEAKQFCMACPVVISCRNFALKNNEQGIWGGMTEEERVNFRTSRFLQARRAGFVQSREQRVREHLDDAFPSDQGNTFGSIAHTLPVLSLAVVVSDPSYIVWPKLLLRQSPEEQSSDPSQTPPDELSQDAS